nr:hypothetical protein [Tanacetum cinerariifolium]
MAALEYCAKHNMIAYLEKIEENAQFHKIVDFLSTSSYSIPYQKVLFYDKKGLNFLGKITPLFPSMLKQAVVEEGKDSGTPTESQPTPSPTQPSVGDQPPLTESFSEHDTSQDLRMNLEGICGSGGDQVKLPYDSPLSGGHTSDRAEGSLNLEELSALYTNLSNRVLAQPPLTESFSEHDTSQDLRMNLKGICGSGGDQVKLPYDSPLSGGHTSDRAEGSLNLEELSALYTNLSNRVLALETVKDAQAKEIITLMARIKKLEKRCKPSISHHRAWLKRPTKDDSAELDAKLEEDMEYIDTEEAVNEGRQSTVNTARPDDDTARPDVRTARQELSTVGPTTPPTTITIFDDEEMTLADTLIKLKDDKAKGVLEEPESAKKMTKSDFNAAQIAIQLEVELQAEVERERHGEEQVSMDYIANLYDKVQVRIDADHELAVRLTHEEHEKYTMVKREKLLAEYFERRKKKLAK